MTQPLQKHNGRHYAAILLTTILFSVIGCGGGQNGPQTAELLVSAREAIAAGDNQIALDSLNQAIELEPSAWAYAMRAKIHAQNGNDDKAKADCAAGIKLDEANEELKWVNEQLSLPVDKRFKKEAPQSAK